jgi:hypothetical protein
MSPVALLLVVLSQVDGGAAVRVETAKVGQAGQLGSQGASLDAEARYLAGLPDAGLTALENTPAFARHMKDLDANWTKLEKRRLAPMRTWAASELWPRIDGKKPLLYFFGGPDAISADVLYPEAPTMVLCGLELPGQTAPLEALPAAEIENALVSLRHTIRSTVDMSYFITSRMSKDMLKSPLKGVLPVLMLFLARNGEHLVDLTAVVIDPQTGAVGEVASPPETTSPTGWRLRFRRTASAPVRELVYLKLDLSNASVEKLPGFFTYLERLGPANSFLKAASYIMHDRNFSRPRGHLLDHSSSVLEDDSGIPFFLLDTPDWDLTYFGTYTAPKGQFVKAIQQRMLKAWGTAKKRPLPFRTGYAHTGADSHLLLAKRKATTGTTDAGPSATTSTPADAGP